MKFPFLPEPTPDAQAIADAIRRSPFRVEDVNGELVFSIDGSPRVRGSASMAGPHVVVCDVRVRNETDAWAIWKALAANHQSARRASEREALREAAVRLRRSQNREDR